MDGTVVAFNVDSIDGFSASGWTVSAHGVARLLTQQPSGFDYGDSIGAWIAHLIPQDLGGRRFNLFPFVAGG
jgi:hypothetical protein